MLTCGEVIGSFVIGWLSACRLKLCPQVLACNSPAATAARSGAFRHGLTISLDTFLYAKARA